MLNLELLDVDSHSEEIRNERGELENVTIVNDGIGKGARGRTIWIELFKLKARTSMGFLKYQVVSKLRPVLLNYQVTSDHMYLI